jgi:NDP-sugar pyrophosphorylase family protein
VRVQARPKDDLCQIAGPGCPYTLPIAGRPLLGHTLKALCDAGISEILVAVDASVAEHVAPLAGEIDAAEIHVAIQPEDDEDATARAAEKVLGPGPLVSIAGDALVGRVEDGEPEVIWTYGGTVDSVLEANSLALDSIKRGKVGIDLSNASIQGRVHVDPSAELDGAKIRGPVHIGAGARIVETYVGPYTSIGAGVTLEGVEIENSIVLPDAQIRYPGRRLEASLVGEGAQIGRDYSLPSALRLRVGPGSEIQLS